MQNSISIITVVFNNVNEIRRTIESCLSQTWDNKEYIIIDGGSTDGTVEIIQEYSSHLSYWHSEPDKGIYDAMNKGIEKSSCEWICFLNSGDTFASNHSLEDVMKSKDIYQSDVIYGNSFEVDAYLYREKIASNDTKKLEYSPLFRHGSSLIRNEIQKKYQFDLQKASLYGYALDWEMLYRVFKAGYRFQKVDVFIQAYQLAGTSDHPYRNLWYNYKITSQGNFSFYKWMFFIKAIVMGWFKRLAFYRWAKAFFIEFMVNDVLPIIPFWCWRKAYLKALGMKIGKGSFIMKRVYMQNPNQITIGNHCHINRGVVLDARSPITIGNNVSISHNVNVMTGSHDVNSKQFLGIFKPITIDDYAWLGIGCTILQGVHIGKGAVACAGAVVTKDIPDYQIVGGIPAKKISERTKELEYQCHWNVPFT